MTHIKILAPHEAQKIAAGEVVERPASIVKELLENSLDAGATHIEIFIEDGGKKSIKIIDNGCGMSIEDAHMSIQHHATSKIVTVDELETLETFGFRGEALSSISAVSLMTIVTRHTTATHATKLTIQAGTIVDTQPVSAPYGTCITVEDVFFNVPARRKFLKKRETEWRMINSLVYAYALDYPQHHFTLHHDHVAIVNCPPCTSIEQRVKQLFDHTLTDNIVSIEATQSNSHLTIQGVISNHQFSRYDRQQLFFFVNKRWVKNSGISKAVLAGYRNVLPQGKFPFVTLAITVQPNTIDINIHPRKEEVLFLNPRIIEHALEQVIHDTLQKNIQARISSGRPLYRPEDFFITPATTPTVNHFDNSSLARKTHHEPYSNYENQPQNSSFFDTFTHTTSPVSHTSTSAFNEPPHHSPELTHNTPAQQIPITPAHSTHGTFRIMGNYAATYIILETAEGIVMVDQHAAHERVMYEQIQTASVQQESVPLLFPEIITLSAVDYTTIEPYILFLQQQTIGIEPWNVNQLIVNSVPMHLRKQPIKDVLYALIATVEEHGTAHDNSHTQVTNALHAMMACKAAVRAGDILNHEEMHALITQLFACKDSTTCPHGRPTTWLLSAYEITKKFKRVA